MKKLSTILCTFALLFGAVGGANSVKAEVKTNWDPSDAYGTTWTAGTNTLSWNKDWFNGLYTGFAPKSNGNTTEVDLSKYTKIHYNITSLSGTASDDNGKYIDLKVRSTGKADLNIKLREGAHDIVFADYSATIDFSKILELTISATYAAGAVNGDPGSAVITEFYLYNNNVTLTSTGFDDKNNGKCTWDSENNKYSWQETGNNTISVLSFQAGVLSKFSKLHIKWSGLTEGAQMRVLFPRAEADGGGNYQKVLTAASGDMYLDLLSDFDHAWGAGKPTADILSRVTSIRIGGNSAPTAEELAADPSVSHSMSIVPSDIYLEADWEVMSIADASDWTAFSKLVDAGLTSLNAELTDDITVSDGKMVGTDSKPYSGTFDGQGHTIDFTYSGSESIVGPFRCVNATIIRDLRTTGSITSTSNLLGGIIGKNLGATTLTRCWSSMSITSTDGSNGRVGGLVGRCADNGTPATNTIVFNYCVYDGAISTSKDGYACGFIGWDNVSAATLNNCLVASTSITGGGSNFTNQTPTISEGKYAYYLTKFGTNNQGTQLNKQLLTSGQAAWELNQGIDNGAWFFGQGNLNTSVVDVCPALTNDNSKKVVRTQAQYTGTKLYVNPGGAIPNAVRLKALGWYIGDTESEVLTSIPADFEGGDDAIKRTKNYFKLKVGAAGTTTLMVPFTTTSLPENVKAYDLAFDGSVVTASEVNVITANKPILIKAPAGEYLFSSSATGMNDMTLADGWIVYGSSTYSNGALTGVYNEVGSSSATDPFSYVPADAYVLQNGAEGLGFYRVEDTNTIKITSFRAYLTAPTTSRSLKIVYADESTDIQEVKNSGREVLKSEEYYNLSGQRVSKPTKGLYIVNGKKVTIK